MAPVSGKQVAVASKVLTDGDVTYDSMKRLLDSGFLADLRDLFVRGSVIDRNAFRKFLELQPIRKGLDTSKLPTWRKVRTGTHRNGRDLESSVVLAGMDNGHYVSEMLGNLRCAVVDRLVEFLVISVRELGFPDGAVLQQVMKAANEIPGCVPCDAEAGPCVRINYREQPPGECLYVAMNPITLSNGLPHIFSICNELSRLILKAEVAASRFSPSAKFIFMRHIPKQSD